MLGALVPALVATPAAAETQTAARAGMAAQATAEGQAPPVVRVAVSPAAAKRLLAKRVRRLIALEVRRTVRTEREPIGPLGEELIRVWIDVPNPRRAIIEVRRTGRTLARRAISIADFDGNVAARVVAIAAGEMVRVQARAVRRVPKTTPDASAHRDPDAGDGAFRTNAGFGVLIAPNSEPALMLGPELGIEHRRGITAQTLYARWLMGEGEAQRIRWLEIGAAFDVRLPLSEQWRLRLSAKAGGVSLWLPNAVLIDGLPSQGSEWSLRAGGLLGIETRLSQRDWLGLSVEPGATLRTLGVVDAARQSTEVGGFTLGIALNLVSAPWLDVPTTRE